MDLKAFPSTYPQNSAYKAAQLTNPARAQKFLHRLREASAVAYLLTSRLEVLENIACETGLDVNIFLSHLSDGSARKEFYKDLAYAKNMEVSGFPTTIVSYGDKVEVIFGYSSYDKFVRTIERVSSGKITPIKNLHFTDNYKLQFILELGSMALAEVREAFVK
ncbi:MAG: hypothetical protein HDR88_12820 [Bacteroides sp.]|nr:hypothetical protein [Bacteroides sp.]